ncbi:hypothetical protein [Nocardia jejuensis]|uniref:hypothetical protein n=1 Tax=Nocardia jejuensis TaxID=328049 RepID=UPI0012FB4A8B|nr:hypothetical protein [Nocardia jejuensis]
MSGTDIGEIHDAETWDVLDEAWNSWGTLDSDVIAHLLNPAFVGGPTWPALRQAHVIARRQDAVLVASSGLADPTCWNTGEYTNGYELEVFGIAPDVPADSNPMTVATSWLGQMVMTVSNLVAQHGFEVLEMVEEFGVITIELSNARLPDEGGDVFVDENGSMVVMLGLMDREIPGFVNAPLAPVRLINVKLLTAAEAHFCVHNSMGEERARREIARRFAIQGSVLWSSLGRPSVV